MQQREITPKQNNADLETARNFKILRRITLPFAFVTTITGSYLLWESHFAKNEFKKADANVTISLRGDQHYQKLSKESKELQLQMAELGKRKQQIDQEKMKLENDAYKDYHKKTSTFNDELIAGVYLLLISTAAYLLAFIKPLMNGVWKAMGQNDSDITKE